MQEPGFAGMIGVARMEITPPMGIFARNWGAAEHETAEGIHRPLTATALTFQTAPTTAPCVLIAVDLGWWRTGADEMSVRSVVLETLNLDPARLLVALSHTHAGPAICLEDRDRPGGHLIAPYLEHLRKAMVAAAQQALATAAPAVLTWGQGRCGLACNRDFPDPHAPRFLCGYCPDVSAEDTLTVGRITRTDGTILATIVHYACHPTTLAWENRLISPDYVGALREVVERDTSGAPCLFLQGASGELAPRDQYTRDTAIADRNGEQAGYAALSVLRGMLPPATAVAYQGVKESGAPLAVWTYAPRACSTTLIAEQTKVELPLKPGMSLEEIDRLLGCNPDPVTRERLRRRRRILQSVGEGETTCMPLWIWKIGDQCLAAQPNEAYSWLQTELSRRMPNPTLALNTVNGPYCGYLPPAALYDQDLYPVWQTPFASGCLERTYEALAQSLRGMD